MRTREQVETELEKNIPRDVVASRASGGGRSLSYLETWYVIDRLNKTFGNLGWDSETTEMRLVSENPARYVSKVRLKVSVPALDSTGELMGYTNVIKEGTGWGSDKPRKDGSVDSPHEMAVKEAESDALKRAAMKLGISMGLGLYDKSGDHVDDAPKAALVASTKFVASAKAMLAEHAPVLDAIAKSEFNRELLNKKITSIARVCIAQGKYTKESFQAMRKAKYSVDTTEALSDTQANELNVTLEALANGK